MKDDGYLTARDAAAYVGYTPGTLDEKGRDKGLRAFYAWVRRNEVPVHAMDQSGGARFRRWELDLVIGRNTEAYQAERETRMERMKRLAIQHARGEAVST